MNSITLIFSQLRNGRKHSTLRISPYELDPVSIVLIIVVFVARSIASVLRLGTTFTPMKADDDPASQEQLYNLPDLSLFLPLVPNADCERTFSLAVDPKQYVNEHFNTNNAQMCLYLASISEPAMLMLLAKQGCPVRPLGAVNVRNRFELLEPALCRAVCRKIDRDLAADVSGSSEIPSTLSVAARFPRPARRVRRGIEIDVEVSIVTGRAEDDSAGADPGTIFRQEFTMLQFMKFHDKASIPAAKQVDSTATANIDRGLAFEISMSASQPYAWARLCKDYNPIHFSPIVAKLLGQPGQLAHGNHAVALCVQAMSKAAAGMDDTSLSAQIDVEQRDAVKSLVNNTMESNSPTSRGWWMEVRFRRPVVLPARFGPSLHANGNGFSVMDKRSGKVGTEVDFGGF